MIIEAVGRAVIPIHACITELSGKANMVVLRTDFLLAQQHTRLTYNDTSDSTIYM